MSARSGPARRAAAVLLLCAAAGLPDAALAHDPSAWGGIYRSRDHGATWHLANDGRFVTAALDLAISPTDPAHLLLATDSGLLRSRNAGRDWDVEQGGVPNGVIHAVAVDADGGRAILSTGSSVLTQQTLGAPWQEVAVPTGATPARAIRTGDRSGRVYLVGSANLFRSDDWGDSWSTLTDGLPEGPVTTLLAAGPSETVLVVAGGELWASLDAGGTWHPRGTGLPSGAVEMVARDPDRPERLFAAGADRLFRSDDRGNTWRALGEPLAEPNTRIRGIGLDASDTSIVVTTDRGLLRSQDRGMSWEIMSDNLPIHLEARPLVRDPLDRATLYVGFSITPYEELWRNAAEGSSSLARLDPVGLAGGGAFLLLLIVVGWSALRWLARFYGPTPLALPRNEGALR